MPDRPSAARAGARLRLLGTFSLTTGRDGASIAISSPRSQSLLAYLALHRGVPQSRQQIAYLFWPDSSDAQARNSLRQVVHQLRSAWPDADRFLSSQASTLTLASGTDLTVDVEEYERALGAAPSDDPGSDPSGGRAALELAAGLYQGALLPDSYDDWIAPERERLAAAQRRVLDRLVAVLELQRDHRGAIGAADRRLRLDPLDEPTCRTLMRLHSQAQDRAGALRVYHDCAATLERELGVEPDAATRSAYETIVREESEPSIAAWPIPAEPVAAISNLTGKPIPLVGRRAEWEQAMVAWGRMSRGEAHMLLIHGEAGIGKSRFAARLAEWAVPQGIASVRTRAYAAEGRLAFAPVADWLRSTTMSPALSRLDRGSLSEISRLMPELLAAHPALPRPSTRIEDWQRQPFFQALARAFLVADQPLLLLLDDLQWCDADTLEWLHFLLRFDRRARLLVVATVRSDELDEPNPGTSLVGALRDSGQLTEIGLGRLDPRQTTELAEHVAGHALGAEQAEQIHLETEGNPLFVVEMVRSTLVDDDRSPATSPASRHLPPKVQAVISGRLKQLSAPARELAALAATVGRAFALEVVREASGVEEDVLVRGVDELVRRQIVRQHGNGLYDFDHDKIREVAYAEASDAQRRLLHRRAAEGLERAYARALDPVSSQIASHYANAGLADRAVVYFQRAAEVEQRVGANLEAISLLQRAMTLLASQPEGPERDDRELQIQTTLGVSLVATEGYGAAAVLAAYARSRELCERLGRPPSAPILRALALLALAQARIDECRTLGEELLSRADRDDDPVLRVEGHYLVGMSLQAAGALGPARDELDAAIAGYDRARSAEHIGLYSQDPAVVCLIRQSLGLWLLGDSEGAALHRTESLALAETLNHPFSLGYALTWDAILQVHRLDPDLARTQAEAAIALGRTHRLPFWQSMATVARGWAMAERGEIEAGVDEMRAGTAAFDLTGALIFKPFQAGLLGEQLGRLGQVEAGLELIEEALAAAERTNEGWCQAELWRRKGDLLRRSARIDEAELAFRRAAEVARAQGAQALEARAESRLADLRSGAPPA